MNSTLIASLFDRLSENQIALGAAIEEVTLWIEQRGSVEVAKNVRGCLVALDRNQAVIKEGIAALTIAGATGA